MRLKTYSKPKGKTEKQKKINKERKSKGPKLNPNYKNTDAYNVSGVDIDLTVLTYGMIDSCNVTGIILNDGAISLKNSWVEAIMVMLDTVVENNPENYKQICIENEVTSYDFSIDTTYGKYTFDKVPYRAYKLYDRGIFVESTFTYEVIFRAIVGLSKALGLGLKDIKFHLVNKNYKESRLNYASVSKGEKIVTIDNLYETLSKSGNHLVSINFNDNVTEVHRIDVALVAFCNMLYDTLEDDIILLGGTESTGICTKEDAEDRQSMPIRESDFCVYTDLDTMGIIQFMQNCITAMQQDSSILKFKFECIDVNEPKHEWEID